VGARYTTAGATARAVAALVDRGGERRLGPAPDSAPLPAADMGDLHQFVREQVASAPADPAVVRRLISTYGTGLRGVLQLMNERPALAAPLAPSCQVTGAEIVQAVRDEMAVTLADALVRRTGAGAGGHPGQDAARAAAAIMAAELGWSAAQVDRELQAFDSFYSVGRGPSEKLEASG
jgi:glycerol-3-phosphate dehydrogenase